MFLFRGVVDKEVANDLSRVLFGGKASSCVGRVVLVGAILSFSGVLLASEGGLSGVALDGWVVKRLVFGIVMAMGESSASDVSESGVIFWLDIFCVFDRISGVSSSGRFDNVVVGEAVGVVFEVFVSSSSSSLTWLITGGRITSWF